MLTRNLIGIVGMLAVASCDREPTSYEIQKYQYAEVLSRLDFECDQNATSENFLSGNVDESAFCYLDGHGGYTFQCDLANTFITSGPSLNLSTASASQKLLILEFNPGNVPFEEVPTISFRGFPAAMTYAEIADSVFRVGNVPLLFEDYTSGYDFSNGWGAVVSIDLRYREEDAPPSSGTFVSGFLGYYLASRFGTQAAESVLKITSVNRKESPDDIVFRIAIEFKCLLFHDYTFGGNELYGQLENGRMEATFSIPKGY